MRLVLTPAIAADRRLLQEFFVQRGHHNDETYLMLKRGNCIGNTAALRDCLTMALRQGAGLGQHTTWSITAGFLYGEVILYCNTSKQKNPFRGWRPDLHGVSRCQFSQMQL
jgi:hypothetical protein